MPWSVAMHIVTHALNRVSLITVTYCTDSAESHNSEPEEEDVAEAFSSWSRF